jgi:hypothetical protein
MRLFGSFGKLRSLEGSVFFRNVFYYVSSECAVFEAKFGRKGIFQGL